ncbi:DsbE family thiol:disulfide interchange protein [Bartonella tamiae]|uniref:Periplasmic protein thiol:disulfide oxidoreductase, DsbE subfamily n=1 Tax=Bartonella tamiae Th239 TaxID=1094558 RepID=J1K294_9HYPH|nr:DsbE family thiol:disulfide interchange protein [Bartonella tamiae]EJF91230.1 periplasmic protein thiol:disulfide oxidoreductase, DsbE subfamily [Bartonella tamiae Th239]EJF93105.1 periplasmic protein thiol:disulfide oxidoreductase, DsbE subfamily [Bartonella tamiae Th307]
MDKNNKTMRWPVALALFGPFILFVMLVVLMYNHMEKTDPNSQNLVPNALAGKTVPQTKLPLLGKDGVFDPQNLKGRVTLVNFWGSWCPPCRDEHPVLMEISKDQRFDLVGINYKDKQENAQRFLTNFGNPFQSIGFDPSGRAAINWGVYGPPETFLLSADGIILYKHIGPLSPQIYAQETLPEIERALTLQQNAKTNSK